MAVQQSGQGAIEGDDMVVVGLAAAVGIDLPDACIGGVASNLQMLRDHVARLDAFCFPEEAEVGG